MVQDQGIDVRPAPYSGTNNFERYQQYTMPANSPHFSGDPNEVYFEAKDGERFVVVLDLLPYYQTHGSQFVWVKFEVDQDCGENSDHYRLDYKTLSSRKPYQSNNKGRYVYKSTVRKMGGDFYKCGFAFNPIQIDIVHPPHSNDEVVHYEKLDMDTDQTTRDSETHGKITVTVICGRTSTRIEPKTPIPRRLQQNYDPPDTMVSSKKVVRDNRVSHAIQQIRLEEAPQPAYAAESGKVDRIPLSGKAGEPVRFTIRYRSRDVLQQLGMIPEDISYITATSDDSPPIKLENGITNVQSKQTNAKVSTSGVKRKTPNDDELETPAVLPSNAGLPSNTNADVASDTDEMSPSKKLKIRQAGLDEVNRQLKKTTIKNGRIEIGY